MPPQKNSLSISNGPARRSLRAEASPAANVVGPIADAISIVREQSQRLQELQELLDYAQTECCDHSQLSDLESRLTLTRRRLFDRIQRFRSLRRSARQLKSNQSKETVRLLAENHTLKDQLAETTAMLETTRDRMRLQESDHRRESEELLTELELLNEELSQLRAESDATRKHLQDAVLAHVASKESGQNESSTTAALEEKLDQLRSEIERLNGLVESEQQHVSQLESLNAELAAQAADQRVSQHNQAHGFTLANESMSWEERKAAILAQLQREDGHDVPTPSERLSMERLVDRTDREIARRDEEIAELRQLLEQQSATIEQTRGGDAVAVGAAAFAQLFDSDEIIREEREKLKTIQLEWKEKLRRAEIELSVERAKLTRERRELEQKQADLEEQLHHFRKQQPAAAETTAASAPPKRRWLSQLGLGDGS